MATAVTATAILQCTFGAAPSTLNVLPAARVMACNLPMAAMMDSAPMVNITPFGMCQNPANPMVAAATAAALGVLTPMPCVPVCPAPWTGASTTVLVGGKPALTNSASILCMWGGQISIKFGGQVTVQCG